MEPQFVGLDTRARSVAGEVVVGVIIVGVLYAARQVLVPIALAIILSFVLGLPVQRLRRLGVRQLPSVLIVVFSAFIAMVGVGAVVGGQIVQLASDLPRYQFTIQDKLKSLHDMTGGSAIVENFGRFVTTITNEYSESSTAAPSTNDKAPPPTPVVVQQPAPKPLQVIERIIGPLLEPLATTGIVLVFVVFILLQQRDLRDRLIWLLGSHDLRRSTEAIDIAAKRLSRFFLMQTGINAAFGLLVGLGLWIIGVPNPALWGGLAMMLRFVPYIGSIMAAVLPVALAAAVDPGWAKALWTLALFLVLEPLIGQVVEPWLYGRSTGLSPIAVAIAATFWTWLWGPIGLVLSTPLTMLLVVVGQQVDRLSYLAVIFGDAPALSAEQSFFHRIMSGNADDAAERAQFFLKDQPLVSYYDTVALPGLRLAQIEANKGAIDIDALRNMSATVEEIVDDFEDFDPETPGSELAKGKASTGKPVAAEPPPPELGPEWRSEAPVLCIAGRSPLDEAAAAMLQQLLTKKGIGVRIASFGSASPAQIMKLDMTGVAMICLSYIAVDGSPTHTRFLIRRLHRKAPGVPVLAGFWTYDDEKLALEELRKEAGADTVATNMRQAVEICVNAATAKVEAVRPLEPAEPLQTHAV